MWASLLVLMLLLDGAFRHCAQAQYEYDVVNATAPPWLPGNFSNAGAGNFSAPPEPPSLGPNETMGPVISGSPAHPVASQLPTAAPPGEDAAATGSMHVGSQKDLLMPGGLLLLGAGIVAVSLAVLLATCAAHALHPEWGRRPRPALFSQAPGGRSFDRLPAAFPWLMEPHDDDLPLERVLVDLNLPQRQEDETMWAEFSGTWFDTDNEVREPHEREGQARIEGERRGRLEPSIEVSVAGSSDLGDVGTDLRDERAPMLPARESPEVEMQAMEGREGPSEAMSLEALMWVQEESLRRFVVERSRGVRELGTIDAEGETPDDDE